MSVDVILKSLEKVEANLAAMSEKADGEMKTIGKVSTDTKAALEAIGTQQREFADRLAQMEQKGSAQPEVKASETVGEQLVKSAGYANFTAGNQQKVRVELKNTLTSADAISPPDRRAGIVAGAYQPLTLEQFLTTVPTSAGTIEYTRETAFTNSAAETAEGVAKPESALTWELVSMPISTVAHWIKISRQLAADAPALAAYVNNRMRYGVDRRVELQLAVGNGVAPNISGVMDTGNFTAHGYAAANLGATFAALVLIRKMMADSAAAGYPPDAILMNPADWATIEVSMLTTAAAQTLYSIAEGGTPRLFGLPVIQSVGMTADTVAVGAFRTAYTIYNREGTVIDMSESDGDNFKMNLVTIRAERRLALATEVPAAVRAGDLTPA